MAGIAAFTLQLLHYYGESGLLGVETAPIMGALIDKFDDQYNTLVLAEGDNYIPGPWLVGGSDPSLNSVPGIGTTALARPDIAIMNAFGTNAAALGNHEFDLGSPVLSGAIAAAGTGATAWVGAQFPHITANLNFAADSALRGLADATLGGTATNAFAGKEASTIQGKIAPYTVVTKGTEKIGIVGATTFDLLSKSSPNGTIPKDDANPATSDLQEVAAYIQAAVDVLRATGVNKIVMVDQLDALDRNKALAPLVSGIDVMVAGGGHERLGDATDKAVAFNGHDADFVGTYPIVTAGADGKPVLIVTTDTEYSYLGRLVLDFDANGEIIIPNLNPTVNGAYASSQATLQAAYGSTQTAAQIVASSTIGTKVNAITSAINNVIITKDSNIFGYTKVYLEGDRAFGRAQEVNLGDISADANLFKTKAALGAGAVIASLKNGGGLRSSIGSIGETGEKIPPTNTSVKPVGAISQLDIENALRFDNKLMVFDTTPQGLLNILNYAAGLTPGNGGYAQIGGVRFSYDPTKAAGQKVQDIAVYDLDDKLVTKIADNGVLLPSAAKISVVTLNFTANGGDGYPIKENADNFRYLLDNGTLSGAIDKTLDFTAVANVPANTLGEQKAFQDYLKAFYATPQTAYNVADTPANQDQRIQNLQVKADTIFRPTRNDFNGDGNSDILWRNDDGRAVVWTMSGGAIIGTASQTSPTSSLDPSWKTAGTGDFNGDGKSDILWRNSDTGNVAIWTMNGSTITSSVLTSTPTLASSWKTVGVDDFSGDGKSDILWRNDDGRVVLWTMDGSTITSSSLTSTPTLAASWKAVGTGDFNGDSKADMLWRNDDGSIALWQMNGTAVTSTATSTASLSANWQAAGTGDFNGDGKTDVLWRNTTTGGAVVWTMNGATVTSSAATSVAAMTTSQVAGIGDYNGDGKSDLLWRKDTGATDVWSMNGSTVLSSPVTSLQPLAGWNVATSII